MMRIAKGWSTSLTESLNMVKSSRVDAKSTMRIFTVFFRVLQASRYDWLNDCQIKFPVIHFKNMKSLKIIRLPALYLLGFMLSPAGLQESFGLSPENPAQPETANNVALAPEVESAVNKAKQAQRAALSASRKALNAAASARAATEQALVNATGYYAITNEQGYHYEGGWRNMLPKNIGYHGFGILTWPNANRYEGEFRNGHKHGVGVFSGPNNDRYEGAFVSGEIQGYGIYTYANGNRYEGEYRHYNRHGYGVLIYANGQRYEGEWQFDEKQGYGVMYRVDGSVEHAGFWQ